MEGKVADDAELDCAIFQVSSAQNRYESIACSKGKTELVASGSLDQLVLHLQEAKKSQSNSSSGTFKLQLAGNVKGSSWFTKSTLARFLHIINSSEVLKSASAILNEMSQLESLYSKEQNRMGGSLAGGFLGAIGMTQQANGDASSSESTKNELLRALDLRLTALKEEMVALLNRAVGSNLLTKQISDLGDFVQHFGTTDSRSWLLKYLSVISTYQPSESQPSPMSVDTNKEADNAVEDCDLKSQTDTQRCVTNTVSPAKLAQVERQSSTESGESSESSDEDQAVVERSRPLIRSASPRRSASPMRRVQIGRSGSRRSTALTIKSLNYYPARERIPLDKDVDEGNSCDGETDQPAKKAESNVKRISVKDAISLFESKQKDQDLDIQKKKAAGLISTTKSVLRRWSAGMGDSLNNQSLESTSDSTSQSASVSTVPEAEKKVSEMKIESDIQQNNLVPQEIGTSHADAHGATSSEMERMSSSPTNICSDPVKSNHDEISDRATASAEWSRQKEAELNQMLMKMMEGKPGKYGGTDVGGAGLDDASHEQKGGSYSQYKEKRDAKLRAGKGGRQSVKEAQFKVLKESLEQNKAVTGSRTGGIAEKRSSPVPQRARRNSSPPVLPKKEVSKTPVSKKASPKPSPAAATRSSWSAGSLTKASSSQKTKNASGIVSTPTPPSRRKAQATPSSQPSPKVERPIQQLKNKKETVTATKPALKGQEEKKMKTVTKASRGVKPRSSPASEDKSSLTTKPSSYSRATKKSSVVPLESKPSRKGTGMGASVGPVVAKSKAPQLDDSSKDSGRLNQAEDKESAPVTTKSTTKVLEADLAQPANDVDENLEISLDNDLNIEKTEKPASSLTTSDMDFNEPVEHPTTEVQPDEDMGISSAAWVEVEHQDVANTCENGLAEDTISPAIAPVPSSSPRIRHSLSQMLQADSNEPEIIEWGNAENPPALVFQKDSPKGFKRLLKFARKNKGETNTNGCASPSVFSEGEDEAEEFKGVNSKNADGVSLGRRAFDGHKANSILSAQSTTSSFSSLGSENLREGHRAATSTKASRSFFSLSTFRSSKSNESKLR